MPRNVARPTTRQRLDSLVVPYWRVRVVLTGLVVVTGLLLVPGALLGGKFQLATRACAVAAALATPLLAWRLPLSWHQHWSYELGEESLELHHGALRRVHSVVPYFRLQHVDVSQGPVERRYGLVRLKVHTASSSTNAEIPGLPAALADRLRTTILDRATGAG